MRLSPSTIKLLLSAKARVRLYEALAVHMDNGLNLLSTLHLLRKRTPKGVWAQESLLDIAAERVEAGLSLPSAFQGCVPELESMLLTAGDNTGSQAEVLRRIAILVKMRIRVVDTIWKALGYPLFLLLLFIGLLLTVAFFVVPAFLTVVDLPRWNGYALLLYDVSTFVASWRGIVFGVALALLSLLIFISFSQWTGSIRSMADKIPPWSLYRLQTSSVWLFTVATMLRNGIRMADALDIACNGTVSRWLRFHVEALRAEFYRGRDITQAFLCAHDSLLEDDLKAELAAYASLPDFAEKLPQLAEQWLHWRVEQVERGCRQLNVVGILAIFGLLMLVALAVQDFVAMLSDGLNLL